MPRAKESIKWSLEGSLQYIRRNVPADVVIEIDAHEDVQAFDATARTNKSYTVSLRARDQFDIHVRSHVALEDAVQQAMAEYFAWSRTSAVKTQTEQRKAVTL